MNLSNSGITIAKLSNRRLALLIALLVATPFLAIPTLSLPNPTGAAFFVGVLGFGIALFLLGIFKWINTYPALDLTESSILEYDTQGSETEIPFHDLKSFGCTQYGATYYFRFKLRSTGRSYRYAPRKQKPAIVEEFLAFANRLTAAIEQYNAREFVPSGGATIAPPIEIGLSKPEKATNIVGRIVTYLFMIMGSFILIGEPGIVRIIGFVMLVALMGAPVVLLLRRLRARARAKSVLPRAEA